MASRVHDASVKPFTVSLLRRSKEEPEKVTWRWSVMDFDVYYPLSELIYREWAGKRERSVDNFRFVLEEIDLDGGGRGSRLWTADDLLYHAEKRIESSANARRFSLRLVSPTVFKESGSIGLFPVPDLVWKGLSMRLNALAPGLVDSHEMRNRWEEMLVSEYCLETRQLDFPGWVMKGVQGEVTFLAPHSWGRDELRRTAVLYEAATFLGVGAKTPMGMGQVRIERHPCPRRRTIRQEEE